MKNDKTESFHKFYNCNLYSREIILSNGGVTRIKESDCDEKSFPLLKNKPGYKLQQCRKLYNVNKDKSNIKTEHACQDNTMYNIINEIDNSYSNNIYYNECTLSGKDMVCIGTGGLFHFYNNDQ